ncbi:hypothetical protein SteCoe_583 [Stentor coeruleus]|uniref:Uncharacterized protein n=1 Tax=Stentor coeruleus TaxID=5963 RepID=A0A1R2D3N3_9CILI|nr:hypothetical protein SteCoe_583 [Stentor coeruleus]
METQANRPNPLIISKPNTHQRHCSDTTPGSSYNSLAPSSSEKLLNLKLDNFPNDPFQYSSIPNSPQLTLRNTNKDLPKPISLIIIEKYFSDICQSIATKNIIDKSLLNKAITMQDVLKDCLNTMPEISLQFYVLMASALKEIQQINTVQDESLYTALVKKLVQIAGVIEENTYMGEGDLTSVQIGEEVEIRGISEIGKELLVRINRVTPRILNIWKKIVAGQREAVAISMSFLLFYCEVDSTIKVSPTSKIPTEKVIGIMRNYINNPGHVAIIIRKTKEYIDQEMISIETTRKVNDMLEKITPEQAKSFDKTLSGYAIYELVYFSLRYYEAYAKEHYNINVFEKSSLQDQSKIDETKSPSYFQPNEIDIKSPTTKIEPTSPRKSLVQTPEKTSRVPRVSSTTPLKSPGHMSPAPKPKSKIPLATPSRPSLIPKTQVPNNRLQRTHSDLRLSPKPCESPTKIIIQQENRILTTKGQNDNQKLITKTPISRTRSSQGSRLSAASPSTRNKDYLEELQYQQLIDEKFRHFLIDKLKIQTVNLKEKGFKDHEIKANNETNAIKLKKVWVEEFEKNYGQVKGKLSMKINDEKNFNAEIVRAQRQLDIILKFANY